MPAVPWRRGRGRRKRERGVEVKAEVKADASEASGAETEACGDVIEISGRTGWMVDCVELRFSDGSCKTYGGTGGDEVGPLCLAHGELITAVTQLDCQSYLGASVAFTTSGGSVLEISGAHQSKKAIPRCFKVPDGCSLTGLLFDGPTLVGLSTARSARGARSALTVLSSDDEREAGRGHGQFEEDGHDRGPADHDSEELEAHLQRVAEMQGGLVARWRDVARPRGGPAYPPVDPSELARFEEYMALFFQQRGLSELLRKDPVERTDGWLAFDFTPARRWVTPGDDWQTAFHGTWWYALSLLLFSGVVLESSDEDRGHEFWMRGVFCSPLLSTARQYARPQVLFEDDIFHRVVLEVQVDVAQRLKSRRKGGEQWIFPTGAVAITRVLIQVNAPPVKGEERLKVWDQSMEALPQEAWPPQEQRPPRAPRGSVGRFLEASARQEQD